MRSTRFGSPATVAAVLAFSCVFVPAAAFADDASVAEQTVNVMNKVWGQHPGMRANHAKGVVVEGSFTPSQAAATVSKATLFAGKTIPGDGALLGFDGRARPPGRQRRREPARYVRQVPPPGWQRGGHRRELAEILPRRDRRRVPRTCCRRSPRAGPNAAKPTKLETFIASHPAVPGAFGSVQTPVSFARETYNGVDAFVFVDAAGKRQPFRFQVVPV